MCVQTADIRSIGLEIRLGGNQASGVLMKRESEFHPGDFRERLLRTWKLTSWTANTAAVDGNRPRWDCLMCIHLTNTLRNPFICLHCSPRIFPGQLPNIKKLHDYTTSIGTHAATGTLFYFRSPLFSALFCSVTYVIKAPVCRHCFLVAFFL